MSIVHNIDTNAIFEYTLLVVQIMIEINFNFVLYTLRGNEFIDLMIFNQKLSLQLTKHIHGHEHSLRPN